jgi:hypothetical protein
VGIKAGRQLLALGKQQVYIPLMPCQRFRQWKTHLLIEIVVNLGL